MATMVLVEKAFRPTKNEIAMAREMAKYENKWIAVIEAEGREKIVASGDRITEAKAEAEKLGFKNPVFRKVPRSGVVFIGGGGFVSVKS